MKEDWAILVGVRRYPGFNDLDGPENDAQDFRKWLVDSSGGDVPPEQCRLILSSDFPTPQNSTMPTNVEVEKAFEWLDDIAEENRVKGVGRKVGRRLYLYFSGHGYAPAKDDAALLMANAAPRRLGNHIAGRLWAEWFYEAGYFEEIALFMDCCRDNYTSIILRPVHIPKVVDNKNIQDRKRFYAYGTQWDRKAWERPNPANNKVHGIFTTALLSGLRGQAAEVDTGLITASSLRSYLYQNMRNFLTEEERANPEIGKDPHVDDHSNPTAPMIFSRIPVADVKKVLVRVHVTPANVGKQAGIYGDDNLTPLVSVNAAPAVWEVPLAKGLYEARLAGGESELFKVDPSLESQDVNFS
ncbi:MAG: caspase family protein [Pyrinomonadaceae bacterium]